MLLPDKHIGFAESLIGLGSFVLENLASPRDVDALWKCFEKVRGHEFPAFHSFDNLVLTVDMLFAIGAVELRDDGKLVRRHMESELCA
jgi:hypothetical protein